MNLCNSESRNIKLIIALYHDVKSAFRQVRHLCGAPVVMNMVLQASLELRTKLLHALEMRSGVPSQQNIVGDV